MAYSSSNLKRNHDTPLWLPTGQFRTATNALASMTVAKDTTNRYIYYLSGSLFYKYDTYKDVHVKLASPPVAAVTASSIKYSSEEGYRGNCLYATSNTMTIAGLDGNILVGKNIEIVGGTGIGQEFTIIGSTGVKVEKSGMVTSASATSLTDTTKRWTINQWIGYQVRIVYGTGTSQVRKVLYNDSTNLYFQDANYQQLEVWNNTAFSATAPYAIPVSTAGSQSNYYIESTIITINSGWTTTPDSSSSYVIKGGGVFMLSAVASAPWSSFQYYDVLSDTWTTKTALGGNLLAALGTDFAIEIITKEISYLSGTSTSVTTRTLTDTSQSMIPDRYCNYELRITSGTGIGQRARIVSNGTNYFEVSTPFTTALSSTSSYEIRGETKKLYAVGNGSSSIYQYSIDYDCWITGPSNDYGQTRNISIAFNGQEAYAMSTGVRNAAGITVLNATPTAGGSGYAVGDLFNITTGGSVGKGRVEAISAGGVVTSVSLYSTGINYTTGTGKVTTTISGSGNNALTVNITTVANVGRITSITNVNLAKGDNFSIIGSTLWDGAYSILAIDSLTTFDVLLTPTSDAVASNSNGTTLIVDSTKNWVVNEHVGKIVKLDIAGPSPTSQFRRITSNTSTTLTVATIVAGGNGTSRYAMFSPEAFGRDRAYDLVIENGEGKATSGTVTSLVDTTKNWQVGQWNGYLVRILAGTGVGKEVAISANDATSLTLTTPGFTPDTTTKYQIMCSFGIGTGTFAATTMADSTKNWIVNIFAGKRVVFTSGTGARQETTIGSNTNNTLTFGSVGTVPDATTTYTILGETPRSTGISVRWAFNPSVVTDKGLYLIVPRGGGNNTIDRYNIAIDYWDQSTFYSPQSETLTTGSSYCYDGVDLFYFSVGLATDFIYIYSFNVSTLEVNGAFQTTALQGATAHIGNLMEIVTSPDGGSFLYLGINTSRLMYKSLIF